MKKFKKILNTILCLFITVCIAFPTLGINAYAKEQEIYTINESFIPSRSFIPQYLTMYSGFKSDLMKKLWEKVIYEEATWSNEKNPDGTQKYPWYTNGMSTWTAKYGANSTFTGLGGVTHKAAEYQSISNDKTDFDAFFALALKTNPEFLGELLGLKGYSSVSTVAYGNKNLASPLSTTRNMISSHLKNPGDYKYFTEAITALTKNGDYLNNSNLKEITIDGIQLDYLFLNSLASQYRMKDEQGQLILSATQIKWIEDNYQEPLYNAYTKGNDGHLKKMVNDYPALFDLIARSKYAANNQNGYGQFFFNYVVDSKIGGGAFLNLNNSINIPGLDGIDDLAGLFDVSEGWCKGLESASVCYNHNACTTHGTSGDCIATMLHKNNSAKSYIQGNPTTSKAYGTDDHSGWRNRYRIKHTKYSSAAADIVRINNLTYNYSTEGLRKCYSRSGSGTGGPNVSCASNTTIAVPIKNLPESVLGTLQTITVYSASHGTNWNFGCKDYSLHQHEAYQNFSSNNSKVHYVKMDVPMYTRPNGSTYYLPDSVYLPEIDEDAYVVANVFDLSELTISELKNCVIYVSVRAINGCYRSDPYNPGEDKAAAYSTTLGYVDCACKVDQCDILGHSYNGSAIFAPDYKSATITYTCTNNRIHEKVAETTTNIKQVINGNTKYYIATGSKGTTFQSAPIDIVSGQAQSNKTVMLNSANTTGTIANQGRNNTRIYPAGSDSYTTFKKAITTVDASVKSGIITPGVKRISVDVTVDQTLEELQMIVFAADGTPIGKTSFSNPDSRFIASLNYTDNEHLEGAYIKITGKASTKNEQKYTPHVGGPEPAEAVTNLKLNSITLYYK